jgi:hypothetical protein
MHFAAAWWKTTWRQCSRNMDPGVDPYSRDLVLWMELRWRTPRATYATRKRDETECPYLMKLLIGIDTTHFWSFVVKRNEENRNVMRFFGTTHNWWRQALMTHWRNTSRGWWDVQTWIDHSSSSLHHPASKHIPNETTFNNTQGSFMRSSDHHNFQNFYVDESFLWAVSTHRECDRQGDGQILPSLMFHPWIQSHSKSGGWF